MQILSPSFFKPGAIVCDVAVPHDVSENTVMERNDVFVFEGGLVRIPDGYTLEPDISRSVSLPKSIVYACFAETAMLGMEGVDTHFSLDGIKTENVEYINHLARKHGFRTAPFKNSSGFFTGVDTGSHD